MKRRHVSWVLRACHNLQHQFMSTFEYKRGDAYYKTWSVRTRMLEYSSKWKSFGFAQRATSAESVLITGCSWSLACRDIAAIYVKNELKDKLTVLQGFVSFVPWLITWQHEKIQFTRLSERTFLNPEILIVFNTLLVIVIEFSRSIIMSLVVGVVKKAGWNCCRFSLD